MFTKYQYEYMMPREFLMEVERMPVFFVPTGLLEWHGDHLPLGLDSLKAHGICLRIANKIGGGIVLPPNYFGRPGYSSFVGTLTYSETSLDVLFTEMFEQLKKVGAKVIVLLTGHYGECQVNFIKKVSDNFMIENPDMSIIAQAEYEGVFIDGEIPADHAGKWETSMFMHLYPEYVHMDRFEMEPALKKLYLNPPYNYYNEEEKWVWEQDLRNASSGQLGKKVIDRITEYLEVKIKTALDK